MSATATESPVLLRTVEVSKAFGGITVLEDASVSLRAGEIHAFMGENGAGKSTLAKIIAGVHTPTHGHIEMNGKTVAVRNPRVASTLGIALIHQEPLTFPDISAAENIFVGRQPMRAGRVDWARMYADAQKYIDQLGVSIDAKATARGLSVADRQMLELASALSQDARILILDETTASLTPGEVERLSKVLHRLKAERRAIAFIGHRMEEIFAFCDRMTILRDGKIVGERQACDTTVDEVLRLMVGRELDLLKSRQPTTPGDCVLKVKGLSRERKFSDIGFELHKGEIVGLAGLVGAGRTDVARSLFGLLPADSGAVEIGGKPETIKNPGDAVRLGLALVPEDRQHQGAFLPMTLQENAAVAVLPKLSPGGWLRDAAAQTLTTEWIKRLSVRCRGAEQPIRELSGGNQQKIVIAKWLETKPRILILDEPTRGIDVGAKSEVHRLVAELAEQGLAVLLISSDLPEILTMSDRVLVMREGKIVREFSRDAANSEAIIAAAAGLPAPTEAAA